MCADPISTALTLFGTMNSYYSQQVAAKAQAQAYNNQAAVDEQNAKIAARQAESTADSYAQQQQEEIRNRMRVAKGAQAASAGSMGVEGSSGSMLDILGGSYEAYSKDKYNLLSNQRNDVWSNQMQEWNYKQSAASNRDAATNTMSAAKTAGLGTILGGAASIYGLQKITKATTETPFYTPTWSSPSFSPTEKSNPSFGLDYDFNKQYGKFYKSKWF